MLATHLALAAVALAAGAAGSAASAVVGSKPTLNVVLFMPDDLQDFWDEAPAHPNTAPYTDNGLLPNMQSIREDGVVFSNSFVAGPKCAPSRFNLMTSRYCSGGVYPNAGADGSRTGTNSNAPAGTGTGTDTRVVVSVPNCKLSGADLAHNLPTTLAGAGYATIMSGKWHLSESLTWQNSGYADHVAAVKEAGFTNPASVYIENLAASTYATYGFTHNMEWMVNTSLAAIDDSVEAGQPFFLYFAPTLPHRGGGNIEASLLNYPDTATPGGVLAESPRTTMRSRQELVDAAHASPVPTKRLDTYVGAMVVDDALGALTQHLADLGLGDDTLVIVTMDHGQLAKDTLYEGGVRTSLMARYPKGIQRMLTVSAYVSNLDIGPSIIEAAGLAYPSTDTSGVDGGSWWPLATASPAAAGSAVATRACVFAEINLERAVTCGTVKYMSWWTSAANAASTRSDYPSAGLEHQLYDLAADPLEQTNLAGEAEHADTLARMQQTLADFLQGTASTTAPALTAEPSTAAPTTATITTATAETSATTTAATPAATGEAPCEDTRPAAFCSGASKRRCTKAAKYIKGCAATCDTYTNSCANAQGGRRARRQARDAGGATLDDDARPRAVLIRGRPVAV